MKGWWAQPTLQTESMRTATPWNPSFEREGSGISVFVRLDCGAGGDLRNKEE